MLLFFFLTTLNYRVDVFFVDYLLGSNEVGLYSVATNLAELLWQIPTALGFIVFSKVARDELKKEDKDIIKILLVIPIVFISTSLILFGSDLVVFLYGEQFFESSKVLLYLLPGIIFMCFYKISYMEVAGKGKPQDNIIIIIISVVLNIIFNAILIPEFGLIGAAISSSISYSMLSILFVIKKFFKVCIIVNQK